MQDITTRFQEQLTLKQQHIIDASHTFFKPLLTELIRGHATTISFPSQTINNPLIVTPTQVGPTHYIVPVVLNKTTSIVHIPRCKARPALAHNFDFLSDLEGTVSRIMEAHGHTNVPLVHTPFPNHVYVVYERSSHSMMIPYIASSGEVFVQHI